jgi:hypothetical protein
LSTAIAESRSKGRAEVERVKKVVSVGLSGFSQHASAPIRKSEEKRKSGDRLGEKE